MRLPRPEVLQRPPQGWASLLLYLGMLAVVASSIADARPLAFGEDGAERTGSLIVVMVAAGLVGFVLGRSTLGIVRSHVLGALAGAAVLVLMVGAAVQDAGEVLIYDMDVIGTRVVALGAELRADIDAWLLTPDAVPVAATLLVLGAICWTTGQFGAFSIFRYDRGGPAVMSAGVLLFLNVATQALAPKADLLPVVPVLAVFSALSMLLLMRLQLVHQSEHWARRHIADTGEVARLFLRSGTTFVLIAVVGASSLSVMAVARPPDIDIEDLGGPLEDLSEGLTQFLSFFAVPAPSEGAATFGDSFEIQDEWVQKPGAAFSARVDDGLRGNYWWGAAADRFDGREWHPSVSDSGRLGSGEELPLPSISGLRQPVAVAATITAGDFSLAKGAAMGAAQASTIDRAVDFTTIGDNAFTDEASLGEIVFVDELDLGESYTVDSLAHDYARNSSTLSANALSAASTEYPSAFMERYTDIAPGTSGNRTRAKRDEALAQVADHNPYDLAIWLQNDLRDNFRYTTSLTSAFGGCGDLGTSECLLEHRAGFCQQFATTMIMVLRELEIPSRIVNGYLPGPIENGIHTVPSSALHSWVEVYFPGFGWVRFDPTPVADSEMLQQEATNFAPGPPIEPLPEQTTAPATAAPDVTPEPTFDADVVPVPPEGQEPTSGGSGLVSGVLSVGGLLALAALVLLAFVLVRVRRLPSADAGLAYRGIVSLATRLGYGPHPSQTEYEYASSLSETLPSVRDDLYVVAGARVESAYGQRQHSGARLSALKRSYARIRTALLRLMVRRR